MIMEARRINPAILFPILFGFFVMGFVDVVGVLLLCILYIGFISLKIGS